MTKARNIAKLICINYYNMYCKLIQNKSNSNLKILSRGLLLLEILAKSSNGKKAIDLAKEMNITRNSVYRYLSEFIEKGYVVDYKDSIYKLGPKFFEMSVFIQRNISIRQIAHPYLLKLSLVTDATIHLAKMIGREAVIIDKIETAKSLPMYSHIGKRVPIYCTGVGKVLLAYSPQKEQKKIIGRIKLKKYTENTITEKEDLFKELYLIKKRGFGIDNSEHEESIGCVACPILSNDGHIIAAISTTDIKRKIINRVNWYAEKIKDVNNDILKEVIFLQCEKNE